MITFLCDCTSKLELPIAYYDDYNAPNVRAAQELYLKTFDSISIDEAGFLVCAHHGMRRYGWRVPNHAPRYAGMTDFQFERLIVWGEKPAAKVKLEIPPSEEPDCRPHIYEGMLDEKARLVISRAHPANGSNGVRKYNREELLAALDEIGHAEVPRDK